MLLVVVILFLSRPLRIFLFHVHLKSFQFDPQLIQTLSRGLLTFQNYSCVLLSLHLLKQFVVRRKLFHILF